MDFDMDFDYGPCMIADSQNGLISRTFIIFSERCFAQNNSKWFLEQILICFLQF